MFTWMVLHENQGALNTRFVPPYCILCRLINSAPWLHVFRLLHLAELPSTCLNWSKMCVQFDDERMWYEIQHAQKQLELHY